MLENDGILRRIGFCVDRPQKITDAKHEIMKRYSRDGFDVVLLGLIPVKKKTGISISEASKRALYAGDMEAFKQLADIVAALVVLANTSVGISPLCTVN